MRFRANLVPSALLAVLLLAVASGSAFAQLCPPNPTGGNRLLVTGPTLRTAPLGGWYGSLLAGSWTRATFRLPGGVALVSGRGASKRVTR